MSRNSYNHPDFKPFQSGSTLCYPSKDYAAFKGGNKTLIKTTPGKNLFKMPNYKVSKENLASLNGKSYNTSAGGAKRKKKGGSLSGAPITENKKLGDSIYKHGLCGPASAQKGGKKRVMKKKGGNANEDTGRAMKAASKENVSSEEMSGGKKTKKSTTKKTAPKKKPVTKKLVKKTAPKKKSTTKKTVKKTVSRKRGGGNQTEGATGLPSEFYTGKQITGYPANSGKDVESAYGLIDPRDAGVGMLAPYNTSNNSKGNTMMKTGGRKSKNKKGGLIPKISDAPFRFVNKVVNTGSKELNSFFKGVQRNYNKSVQKIQSARNGMARLQGGLKKNRKTKKSLKGGDGSDFAATRNSRGPVNAPDDYWGVDGEKWFKQFAKTGNYIPNSALPRAAAPILTGGPKVDKVTGFSSFESTYEPLTGGKKTKKKSTARKPVKKTASKKPVKKTTTKKKPVKKTTKKKTTTKKK